MGQILSLQADIRTASSLEEGKPAPKPRTPSRAVRKARRAHLTRSMLARKLGTGTRRVLGTQPENVAKCIATDDPRLKEK